MCFHSIRLEKRIDFFPLAGGLHPFPQGVYESLLWRETIVRVHVVV